MSRTQLNINIDPQLMQKMKESAIKSGKTITEFVSESIFNNLENFFPENLEVKIALIEERVNTIEENLRLHVPNQKTMELTDKEAENFSQFFKGIFEHEMKKKRCKSSKEAWNDLIAYIDCFDQWNDIYTLRLKEIIFIQDGDPFSKDEINSLTNGEICSSPIRTGFINWINKAEKGQCSCSDKSFPSSKSIYQKGQKLLEKLYVQR